MLNDQEERFCRVYVARKCDGTGLDIDLLNKPDVMMRIVDLLEKRGSFDRRTADEICDDIANGLTMRAVCRQEWMPTRVTFSKWCDNDAELYAKYVRAREERAEGITDDMHEIEQKTLEGLIDDKAARVVLGSMQWRASKLSPKKLGDKVDINHTGIPAGVSTNVIVSSDPVEVAREYQRLMSGE